ncbi:hypothetical protein E0L21_22025 [Kosakonia quasisacchari]|uniref:Uncharacterized protein n=1 Tax=Kosakonia quasisacchari TaxID=2529380 RepID=A0A4R0GP23_9ENTR|nr:hypothetical protein E0L21_22025 [Kosakonia quasisacchari]
MLIAIKKSPGFFVGKCFCRFCPAPERGDGAYRLFEAPVSCRMPHLFTIDLTRHLHQIHPGSDNNFL